MSVLADLMLMRLLLELTGLRWIITLCSYIKSFKGLNELWVSVIISLISLSSSGRLESAGSKLPV